MKLVYFAWVREKTGLREEEASPPDSVSTVAQLIDWLISRGDNYKNTFEDLSVIRVAVNQEYVQFDSPVQAGDEVAFFPPVTGG